MMLQLVSITLLCKKSVMLAILLVYHVVEEPKMENVITHTIRRGKVSLDSKTLTKDINFHIQIYPLVDGEEKSKQHTYKRVNQLTKSPYDRYGKCKEDVADETYSDCNCEFEWRGSGGLASCGSPKCGDKKPHELLQCKDDSKNCPYSRYVRNNPKFHTYCYLGGKKKLCSDCSKEKSRFCAKN